MHRTFIIAATIGLLASSTSQADILTGLLHDYTFNGSNANDSAGSNNGSAVGSPIYGFDATRGSTVVTVSDNNYIELPNVGTIPTGAAPRTFAIWARVDAWENDAGIWHHGALSSQQDFSLEIGGSQGSMTFNGWFADLNFSGPADTGVWHHYAITYDGTTLRTYVDGAFVNSQNFALNTASNIIRLGGQRLNNSQAQLNGALDDFRIYNRALSDSDVNELFLVPEPGSAILFALGSLGLVLRRRR